jgi:flagellar basal-body rod modification protein FlgD
MTRISGAEPLVPPTTTDSSGVKTTNDLRDLDVGDFLNLMIAELQNQDPLDPLDNSEMVAQLGQIREISSTNQLIETLNQVFTGQNLSTASSLIGREVTALTDDAQEVEGVVERVSVETDPNDPTKRSMRVHVDTVSQGVTRSVDDDAKILIKARTDSTDFDNVHIDIIHDPQMTGKASVTYREDSLDRSLLIRIKDGETTARDVVRAIHNNEEVNNVFDVKLAKGGQGDGLVHPADSTRLKGSTNYAVKLDNVREVIAQALASLDETSETETSETETTEPEE